MQFFYSDQDDWETDQLLNFEKQEFDVLLYDNNYLIFLILMRENQNTFQFHQQDSKLSKKKDLSILRKNFCFKFLTFESDHDERRLRLEPVALPVGITRLPILENVVDV